MDKSFIIDFLIGLFLVNSMPHFIVGISKIRFLSLFGYTPVGNISYSVLQFIAAIILISYQYGFSSIYKNGIFLAGFLLL